jgi:hypothetical protein
VKAFEEDDWSLTAAELRSKKGDERADAVVEQCQAWMENVDPDLVYIADMNDADSLREGFELFNLL